VVLKDEPEGNAVVLNRVGQDHTAELDLLARTGERLGIDGHMPVRCPEVNHLAQVMPGLTAIRILSASATGSTTSRSSYRADSSSV